MSIIYDALHFHPTISIEQQVSPLATSPIIIKICSSSTYQPPPTPSPKMAEVINASIVQFVHSSIAEVERSPDAPFAVVEQGITAQKSHYQSISGKNFEEASNVNTGSVGLGSDTSIAMRLSNRAVSH